MTRALTFLLALVAGTARAHAHQPEAVEPGAADPTYIVGVFHPEFTPPPPGTYRLPVIDTVSDHPVLGSDGRVTTLFALKRGRAAVVAFVYTTCAEAAGCPVSMAVLTRLDRLLAADPALAAAATLVTVSFDPARDDPARMAEVRALQAPRSDWHFVTTHDEAELGPLLDDFGQPVARLRYPDGRATGLFRHVLKVFLLDAENRVRNVYSAGFLSAELVLNDVRTVLMQPAG